jgi:hypothetical protein
MRHRTKFLRQLYVFAAGLNYSSMISDPAFDVRFLAWEVFRDNLLRYKDEFIRFLVEDNYRCFIGGPDLQSDLTYEGFLMLMRMAN